MKYHAISKKADTLFTADMENGARGMVIDSLLQGTPDQTSALIENGDKLFTPEMNAEEIVL